MCVRSVALTRGQGESWAVDGASPYGMEVRWEPARPRLAAGRLLVSWIVAAVSVAVAARLLPGVTLSQAGSAAVIAAAIAVLNAILPPLLAALRLPFMLVAGFLLVLAADALVLVLADDWFPDRIHVSGFGDALLAALLIAAVGLVLQV